MFDLLTQLEFGEGFWYNALPIGKFHDPRYGVIRITPKLVKDLAGNFGKVPAYEPPVKLGHGDGASSPGVIKKVEARADGLWIQTDFQDAATLEAVKGKQYRYMSAEYTADYMDKATGKSAGPALLGVALTNQPAHPGVKPITFSDGHYQQEPTEPTKPTEEEKQKMDELERKLAEMTTKMTELSQKFGDMEKENTTLKTQLADAQANAAKIEQEKHVQAVQAFCDKQIAAGIPPAVIEKIKPVMLATTAAIKLSDKEEKSLQDIFGEMFADMSKVELGFKGGFANPNDKAVMMADDIAAYANGTGTQNNKKEEMK